MNPRAQLEPEPRLAEPAESLLAVLRVPLLLTLLGALFLLEDHGGWPFTRTWPSLLVLWGALLAAERRRREP